MGNDGSRDFEEEEDIDGIPDDPKYVAVNLLAWPGGCWKDDYFEQPARANECTVVILKLPRKLKLKPILKELIKAELLEESQTPSKFEGV